MSTKDRGRRKVEEHQLRQLKENRDTLAHLIHQLIHRQKKIKLEKLKVVQRGNSFRRHYQVAWASWIP